jgi:hypothetical protein
MSQNVNLKEQKNLSLSFEIRVGTLERPFLNYEEYSKNCEYIKDYIEIRKYEYYSFGA